MGWVKRLGGQLAESDEHLRAQEIRKQVSEVADVEQIAACRPRERSRVAGIVQSIKFVPREGYCSLEVEIFDGTDEISGMWLGRREIPGIELGRCLVLEGTIRRSGINRLQILNPAYELVLEKE